MPFGPRVLFTKSPTAIAPTKAERRAFSPFSSVTSSAKIWVGLKEAIIVSEAPIISLAARTRRFLENAKPKVLGRASYGSRDLDALFNLVDQQPQNSSNSISV